MTAIPDMTDEELNNEHDSVCRTIRFMPYGMKDLMWRDALEDELDKRDRV